MKILLIILSLLLVASVNAKFPVMSTPQYLSVVVAQLIPSGCNPSDSSCVRECLDSGNYEVPIVVKQTPQGRRGKRVVKRCGMELHFTYGRGGNRTFSVVFGDNKVYQSNVDRLGYPTSVVLRNSNGDKLRLILGKFAPFFGVTIQRNS